MVCEKGHFCKIHPSRGCIKKDYDHAFYKIEDKEPFYVEEVHFVCPRFLRQNEKNGGVQEVAQLVTYEHGTINSGAKESVKSARKIKGRIEERGEHIKCKIIKSHNAKNRKPVYEVVEVE